MKDETTRYKHTPNTLGVQNGSQTIIVRQVLGEKEKQKVLDIHVTVPQNKPAIEQIIDVFVKNVTVNCVDVITDKVIVRGEFEVKAIYVACLPGNPVHALEIKHYKWTQDIDMPGARRGMDAEAAVLVTFVDYDVAEMTRAYKYKYKGNYDPCDTTPSCTCNTKDSCEEEKVVCDEIVKPPHHHHHPMPPIIGGGCEIVKPCPMPCPPPQPPKPPKPPVSPPKPCEESCCREFDVSVILRVTAKVLVDREVQMNCQPNITSGATTTLPEKPKG